MRKIDSLLAEYGESHQNSTNKLVHWFAVPVIVWTIIALLWHIPTPDAFEAVPYLNWATVLLAASVIYYLTLSLPIALGMVAFSLLCIGLIKQYLLAQTFPLWQFALILFVVAWIAQFWGHKVEGKKPSFFKDVVFLMVGPAWLLSFIYKRLGIAY